MFTKPKISHSFLPAMLDKIKEQHKATFDGNDIRDFIDAFIKEMKEGHETEAGFTVSQPTIINMIMFTIKLTGKD